MSKDESLESLLQQIGQLLDNANEHAWAMTFHKFADEAIDSPESTKFNILTVFGGMGSFNDLVLHGPTGLPLVKENHELDRLRQMVFGKCRE